MRPLLQCIPWDLVQFLAILQTCCILSLLKLLAWKIKLYIEKVQPPHIFLKLMQPNVIFFVESQIFKIYIIYSDFSSYIVWPNIKLMPKHANHSKLQHSGQPLPECHVNVTFKVTFSPKDKLMQVQKVTEVKLPVNYLRKVGLGMQDFRNIHRIHLHLSLD